MKVVVISGLSGSVSANDKIRYQIKNKLLCTRGDCKCILSVYMLKGE